MYHNFYQHQTQVPMALQLSYFLTLFFLIFSISSSATFITRLDSRELGLKREKLSHFRLYWHDIVSGKAPTAVMVVPPPSNSSTGFGSIMMIDDPLTLGPDPKSKLMGRAQGMYSSAAQDSVGLLMTMNFVFVEGKYNGSTIAVLGHNGVFDKVREMAVVGGSGLFRFARGYVKASTHSLDFRTGDAVVEYNCYVLHY